MNERIRELAEQAKFIAEEELNRQISYNTELKAFAEKFAELIVKECISIAEYRVASDWDSPNDANHIINEINEHFGIKE